MKKFAQLLVMVWIFITVATGCSKEQITENGTESENSYTLKQAGANYKSNFPLTVNNGQLTNSQGLPFLIVGDSPWYLMQRLNREDADKYLENRKSKGVNSLLLGMIASDLVGSENAYGEEPFIEHLDFSTPNPRYFEHIDYIIKDAEEKGIAMFVFPAYLGYDMGSDHPEGFYEAMVANGPDKMYEYGKYIGNRYKDYGNIVWAIGGDAAPDDAIDEVRAMVKGIAETSGEQIFTVHNGRFSSGLDEYRGDKWIDLNSTYADYQTAALYLYQDYQRNYPFYFIEGTYENSKITNLYVRSQMYTPVLMGADGYFYGNEKQYPFDPDWENPSIIESQGSLDLKRSGQFFRSRAWYDLEPDVAHSFLLNGAGNLESSSYAPSAVTSDGVTGIVYTPDNRTLTVDLTRISGQESHGWWYQPSTGKVTDMGIIPDSSSVAFTPPAIGDWLLVIDDAKVNLPAPGN